MKKSKTTIVNELRLLSEGKWSDIMKGVRKYPQGPFVIVAIVDGKVVGQKISITDPQIIPAHYEDIKRKHPSAKISIENGEGLSIYNESVSENIVTPDQLKQNIDKLVKTAKDALGLQDDKAAKDYVSGFIGEDNDIVGRGIEAGMNPEVEADKYEEYRELMTMLAAEEGGEQEMNEDEEPTNDPIKLKQDVAKLMAKLDISAIRPYLKKIDNAVEQAEVIGQFAELIGVPKAKLSMVVAQLRTIAENDVVKMTKNKLIESVTGRKIIKTIKVKDIK